MVLAAEYKFAALPADPLQDFKKVILGFVVVFPLFRYLL
jgi:hypothetical protein